MFDHVSLTVSNLQKSIAFYRAALEPLGLGLRHHEGEDAGFGREGQPQLWLHPRGDASRVHFCVEAPTRAAVRAFHAAALKHGGRDHGAPGPRPDYGANYYAAFVLDPDGNNVEAVCRRKE